MFTDIVKVYTHAKPLRTLHYKVCTLTIINKYYFDDKTSLTLSGFYRKGDQLSYSRNVVNDITNIDIVSSNERIADETELEESFEYALDFYKDLLS